MNRFVATFTVALTLFAAGTLSAQPAPRSLPRIDADELLAGRPVAASFEPLQPLLAVGREIVVTDEQGRQRRGRLRMLSTDTLVLATPVSSGGWEGFLPLYWPADLAVMLKRRIAPSSDRAFDEAVVTRIDVVDPTGNGTAIGAGVGAAIAAATYLWERNQPENSLKGLGTFLAVVVGIPISARIGHVIDRANNEPVYQRSTSAAAVTFAPAVGYDRALAIVTVRW